MATLLITMKYPVFENPLIDFCSSDVGRLHEKNCIAVNVLFHLLYCGQCANNLNCDCLSYPLMDYEDRNVVYLRKSPILHSE